MYAKVVVDIKNSKVDRIFTYSISKDLQIYVGSRVLVPFGTSNKEIEGYVLGFCETIDFDPKKAKSIIAPLSTNPEFTLKQIELAYKIKNYYQTTLASALRLMFPSEMRGGKVNDRKENYIQLILDEDATEKAKQSLYSKEGKIKSPVMHDILCSLQNSDLKISQLTEQYSSAHSSIKSLQRKGWVQVYQKTILRTPKTIDIQYENENLTMSSYQQHAIDQINGAFCKTFLLHGVTGSGKTEVYIKTIEHCINQGKSAIMLVPEIGLTPQLISMFNTRLGKYIAVYHSSLSSGERYDEWKKINTGQAKIVIGPRSALFVPLKNIGLIIIDEEHEGSYQSDVHPKYKTHDVAKMRAQIEGANLVFASATPSVETFYSAQKGDMQILSMPKRIHNIAMPDVYIEDMRKELRNGNRSIFSARLYSEIKKTLAAKKQIILFINRRGYSSFVMCRGCGYIVRCDNCDISMTLHENNELICHHCNSKKLYDKTCPQCNLPYMKIFGIGTQQIEHEVKKAFKGVTTLRMDFDTTRTKNAYSDIYTAFKNKEADILIGTQLVAKGHDFDDVTLVGAMAADVSLHFPDYLAVERTFSLLQQASGRAGRKSKGTVVIQTYKPNHYAITAAKKHDYHAFYTKEIEERRKINAPPFGTIIRIIFSGDDIQKVCNSSYEVQKALKSKLQTYERDILLLSTSPAPIKQLRSKYRYHIVIKAKKTNRFLDMKDVILTTVNTFNFDHIQIGVDINPQNMF